MKNSGRFLTQEQIDEQVKCFEYIREDRKPVGIVVLDCEDRIGWSLCNDKDEPLMDKGLLIALSRAKGGRFIEVKAKLLEAKIAGIYPSRLELVANALSRMHIRRIRLRMSESDKQD